MSLKALIVEDDELLLETLEKGFRHEGFEVDIAKERLSGSSKGKNKQLRYHNSRCCNSQNRRCKSV